MHTKPSLASCHRAASWGLLVLTAGCQGQSQTASQPTPAPAVSASASAQHDQANAEQAWALVMQLVRAKNGFITDDLLRNIVKFKLREDKFGKGDYSIHGGVNENNYHYRVDLLYLTITYTVKGYLNFPSTHTIFAMPKSGCIKVDRMRENMIAAGLQFVPHKPFSIAKQYSEFFQGNGRVVVEYVDHLVVFKTTGIHGVDDDHLPPHDLCVVNVIIDGHPVPIGRKPKK